MTEKEILQRAKMYMDKLARGVNPLDDTEIPEGEVVNNIRLSRCFLYVSDVLGSLIDGKKGTGTKKTKKSAFTITREQVDGFKYSKMPLTVAEFAGRINSLINQNEMKKISRRKIFEWLISIRLIEEKIDLNTDRTVKAPTFLGMEIGISYEQKISQNGFSYNIIVLTEKAQHFVIDNIDGLIEYLKNIEANADNQGQPWNGEQDSLLSNLFKEGKSIEEISEIMKRTRGGIKARLKRLGLIAK